jgi:hypothetical protein
MTAETLERVIDTLNRYANLLLVVITAAYVWLTWRTLKALQRTSLREREVSHIDDIKRYVVRPVIAWLESQAVPKLRDGLQLPLVLVKAVSVPRTRAGLGEPQCDWRLELTHTFEDPHVTSHELFAHVAQIHFPKQLREFEAFTGGLRQLASDCAAFSRNCADKIADSTRLRRSPAAANAPEFADSDTLVEVCLRDTIAGMPKPQVGFESPAAGALQVNDIYHGRALGKGLTEPTKVWAEAGVAYFQEQWAKSKLPERIRDLSEAADAVHRTFEGLEFTFVLPSDCEYIGGRNPSLLMRAWRTLTRRV